MPDNSDLFGHVASEAFGGEPRAVTEEKVMNLAIIEALRSARSAQDNVAREVGGVAKTVHQIELQMVRFEGLAGKMDRMEANINQRFEKVEGAMASMREEIDHELEGLKADKLRRDGHADVRSWFKPAAPWIIAALGAAYFIAERLPPVQ